MKTETNQINEAIEGIELSPSYKIPLFLILSAIPLLLLSILWWKSIGFVLTSAIAIFGLFLILQTATIKLKFTTTALLVYRGEKEIRSFPYTEWTNWRIFWQPIPILFYFREVNSIHFLPIIFDPQNLVSCLEKYCPQKK